MPYQIDQSGKIEQTDKPTVLALSNDEQVSLLLLSKHKRILQDIFRQTGKPRMFIIQTFSSLLFLLVEELITKQTILIIDREYPGYETLIKNYLLQLLKKRKKLQFSKNNIRFSSIGRKNPAHKIANRAFYTKRVTRKILLEEILSLILVLEH